VFAQSLDVIFVKEALPCTVQRVVTCHTVPVSDYSDCKVQVWTQVPHLCVAKKIDVMSSEYQNTYLSYVDAMLN